MYIYCVSVCVLVYFPLNEANLSLLQLHDGDENDSPPLGFVFQVHDGEDSDSPPLGVGQYCGSTAPEPLVSSYNRVTISLLSDAQAPLPRFTLVWTEQMIDCGGELDRADD